MTYAKQLLDWFDLNKRQMPWRNTNDPYKIWVSEIMLQQTKVDTVIPYYEKFIQRFPTIASLAQAHQDEVYRYWQGLGYYRRAQNLHKGAQLVNTVYDGVFPQHAEEIIKIPGIGPYTMGAIMSIAFHQAMPAVDGNVMRVLSRQFLIQEDIAVAKNRKIFEEKLMKLMPDDPNRFTQAMMELGALVCTPKAPKCTQCPMQQYCIGYQKSCVLAFPVKLQKIKITDENYKVLIIKKQNKIWMEKRDEEGILANLWGFPMLDNIQWKKFDKNNLLLERGQVYTHVFTHKRWHMTPIFIEWSQAKDEYLKPYMKQEQQNRYVTIEEIDEIAIATAFNKLIKGYNLMF